MTLVNKEMIEAALEVLLHADAYGEDLPYTREQTVEAMLLHAMRFYVHPPEPEPTVMNRTDRAKDGFVYFISDGEAIKIGKAKSLKKRVSTLQVGTPRPLTILGAVPGGQRLERKIHRQFEDFRMRGEWFQDCLPIRDYISEHTKTIH